VQWDKIEEFQGSLLQHGRNNDRIYLMKLGEGDTSALLDRLEELRSRENYSKLFAKVPSRRAACFLASGWGLEALVPGFYAGREDALFLCKYFDPRRREPEVGYLQELCRMHGQVEVREPKKLPESLRIAPASETDVEAMAQLYRQVFERYPFPIHDPDYLSRTMVEEVDYYAVWEGDRLVGLSSAEKDGENQNVEMTDFAVHPDYRGYGLGQILLEHMDREMAGKGIKTAYTIARLRSKGMNATFLRAGYTYSGTLFRNTNISDGLESMNVYYKTL